MYVSHLSDAFAQLYGVADLRTGDRECMEEFRGVAVRVVTKV